MSKLKLKLSYYWYKLLIKLGLKTDEVFYIGGSEALPPPLNKEEEALLIEKLPN
ncbi:MAG: RNA polymerase sporulation sigma factor SigE, partial [Bacillus sp. (in: firmicutes)]